LEELISGVMTEVAPPLRESILRSISPAEYEFSPVGQVSLDRNGRIRCLNRASADMLRGSKSALLNVSFLACIEKSYYRAFLDHLTTCVGMRMEVWTEIGMAEFTRCRRPVELRSAPGIDPVSGGCFAERHCFRCAPFQNNGN
jgi:hypothetical protein